MSWHITKKGEVALCSAQSGNCPLGGNHYETEFEAKRAFEFEMGVMHPGTLEKKKTENWELLKDVIVETNNAVLDLTPRNWEKYQQRLNNSKYSHLMIGSISAAETFDDFKVALHCQKTGAEEALKEHQSSVETV